MREYQGYLLALLTTMLWGSSFVAARSLLAGTPQTDPLFMVFCRFGIGALTLFLLAFLLKKDVRIKSRRHAWQIFRAASLIYWGMSLLLLFYNRQKDKYQPPILCRHSSQHIVRFFHSFYKLLHCIPNIQRDCFSFPILRKR